MIKFNLREKNILSFYLITILLFLCFLYFFPISTNLENYKSISSIMFQGLASVLAIVITLTLVSVQIFSQNYSTRVLKIFSKKNYALWCLMIVYSITLIYNLMAPYYVQNIPDYLMIFVNLSVLLTIISLLALIPYLKYTIEILQPEEVLKIISKQINKDLIEKIFKYDEIPYIAANFSNFNKIPSEEDPLIPFIEIIGGSINKKHPDTAEEGLILLGNQFSDLDEKNIINAENGKAILKYFLQHIKILKYIAIINNDSRSLNQLRQIKFWMGLSISKKIGDYSLLTRSLDDNSEIVSKKEFEYVRVWIISDIKYLLKELMDDYKKNKVKSSYLNILSTIQTLNYFWVSSLENHLFNTQQNVELAFYEIIKELIKNGLFGVIEHELMFMMELGTKVIKEDPELIKDILPQLDLISDELFRTWIKNSKTSEKKLLKIHKLIINILESIKFIGYESLKSRNYDVQLSQYYYLEEIIRLEDTLIVSVVNSLKKIAYLYIENIKETKLPEKEFEDILIRIIRYNANFGVDLAHNGSDSVINSIDVICSINEHPNISQSIKLKVGSETFKGLCEIFDELIIYNPNKLLERIYVLNQMRDWASDNEFNFIKSDLTSYLGELSLKLVDKKIATEDIKILVKILEGITLKSIDQRNKEEVNESLNQIELLTHQMVENKVPQYQINIVFDSLQNISKKLLKEEMEDILNSLDNWADLTHIYFNEK